MSRALYLFFTLLHGHMGIRPKVFYPFNNNTYDWGLQVLFLVETDVICINSVESVAIGGFTDPQNKCFIVFQSFISEFIYISSSWCFGMIFPLPLSIVLGSVCPKHVVWSTRALPSRIWAAKPDLMMNSSWFHVKRTDHLIIDLQPINTDICPQRCHERTLVSSWLIRTKFQNLLNQ